MWGWVKGWRGGGGRGGRVGGREGRNERKRLRGREEIYSRGQCLSCLLYCCCRKSEDPTNGECFCWIMGG